MKSFWVKQKGNAFNFCNLLVKFNGEIYVDRYHCVGEGYIKDGEVVGEVYEGLSPVSHNFMPHIDLYEGADISDIKEMHGQKSRHWDRAVVKKEY